MTVLFVVNHPRDWPFEVPNVAVTSARRYLVDSDEPAAPPQRVVNLCKSYRYQGRGYYVSLLAEARGHRPLPDVRTIEDLNSIRMVRMITSGLDATLQRALESCREDSLELQVFFGRESSGRYDELARQLFEAVPVPLLRARFERSDGTSRTPRAGAPTPTGTRGEHGSPAGSGPVERRSGWRLARLHALSPADVALERRSFLAEAANAFAALDAPPTRVRVQPSAQPAIAILHDPSNPDPPSNPQAIAKFVDAASSLGMRCEVLSRNDVDRLSAFDALFIRDTTNVSHYTYAFSRRAAAQGLAVIDDPDSILRCTNKVYLHELLTRHRIPTPKTMTVDRDDVGLIVPTLGLPCIVKQPDSAFSLGVKKVHDEAELERVVDDFLGKSELIVAQEFVPTAFDWRVGVLDGRALFVCQYFMAPGHWQVIKREKRATKIEGTTLAMSVGEAPACVVDTAVEAAKLIGDGLYGVDLKQVDDRCFVIEINDNPNVDAGNEDAILRDALYREVMGVFLRRIRERRRGAVR